MIKIKNKLYIKNVTYIDITLIVLKYLKEMFCHINNVIRFKNGLFRFKCFNNNVMTSFDRSH